MGVLGALCCRGWVPREGVTPHGNRAHVPTAGHRPSVPPPPRPALPGKGSWLCSDGRGEGTRPRLPEKANGEGDKVWGSPPGVGDMQSQGRGSSGTGRRRGDGGDAERQRQLMATPTHQPPTPTPVCVSPHPQPPPSPLPAPPSSATHLRTGTPHPSRRGELGCGGGTPVLPSSLLATESPRGSPGWLPWPAAEPPPTRCDAHPRA